MRKFLSWEGRTSRRPFALVYFGSIALGGLAFGAILAVVLLAVPEGSPITLSAKVALATGFLALVAVAVPMLWITTAVAGRRLHDFGQPAWLAVGVLFINILANDGLAEILGRLSLIDLQLAAEQTRPTFAAVNLLAFIVLVFWPGSIGSNLFGPDPRDRGLRDEIAALAPPHEPEPAARTAGAQTPVHVPLSVRPTRRTFGQRTVADFSRRR